MSSLIDRISLVEGDSSDIWMFYSDSFPSLDNNWQALLVIRNKNINGTIVLNRLLPKNDGSNGLPANSRFVFQLTPTETSQLGVGTFFVSIKIENTSLGFSQEIVQCQLKINKSGQL